MHRAASPGLSLLSFAVIAASASGCTWTSDGGVGARLVSPEVVLASEASSWKGEPIDVSDAHGSVVVVGVPGKTNITVRAQIVAGARSETEAEAAFADVADQIEILRVGGRWRVTCGQALAWHGSVDPASTGCTQMRVEVPAGTASAPITLTARASYGGVHVSGVTVADLTTSAPFGLVADVVPAEGAKVSMKGDESLVSGFCSTILRVPRDTAAREVSLVATHADLEISGVDPGDRRWWPGVELRHPNAASDLRPRTKAWSGAIEGAGTKMASVVLSAHIGKAVFGTDLVPTAGELGNCQQIDPARAELGF